MYQLIRRVNDDGGQSTSVPDGFSIWNKAIYLTPVPDASYTFDVYYQKSYPTLTDGQSNDFTNEAEDLIESRSRWWMYTRVIKNKEKADIAAGEENDAIKNLRRKTQRIQGTRKLKGWP